MADTSSSLILCAMTQAQLVAAELLQHYDPLRPVHLVATTREDAAELGTRIPLTSSLTPSSPSVCLIYVRPEVCLQNALSVEMADVQARLQRVERALNEWCSLAQDFLDFHRSHRMSVHLYDADHLALYMSVAQTRLGLSTDRKGAASFGDYARPDASCDDAILPLLARQAVANHPTAQALATALDTCAQQLSNTTTEPKEAGLLEVLSRQQAQAKERQAMFEQQDRMSADLAGLEAQRMTLQKEVRTLRERLHSDRKAADTKLKWSWNEIVMLRSELERVMGSRSMRLTSPLRWLGRLLHRSPN